MKTSDKGRKFIEDIEGLILDAYDDRNDHVVPVGGVPQGTLTIGYGHTTAAGPPRVYVGQRITNSEADNILASDLTAVEIEVNHLVTVPLTQNQFDALVSFEFNLGVLRTSTLLRYLNQGQYQLAAEQFLVWNHEHRDGQLVVVDGLTRRRQAEKEMFETMPSSVTIQPVHPATTAVVVGPATVAVAVTTAHSPLIFLGIIAAGIILGVAIHYYINRKVINNVVTSDKPVVGG